MRLALISDLHANLDALQAVWPSVREADLVVCLGDFVGYYTDVNQVLEFVRAQPIRCIRGNHDQFLLAGTCPPNVPDAVRFGIEWADRVIAADHRRWLSELPLVWGGMLPAGGVGEPSALFVHGSPWAPLEDYLFANSPRLAALDEFHYDLLAFGQTHRPYQRIESRPAVLNPGSVGQSRHRPGVACGALLEWGAGKWTTAQMIECPYDFEPVVQRALAAGAGQWIRKHLSA